MLPHETQLCEHLSNLYVLMVKLHNFHWNVAGENFFTAHEKTEEMYDYVFKIIDETAERIQQLGIYPPSSMKSFLEQKDTQIKEAEARQYSEMEVYKELLKDFESIISILNETIKNSNLKNDEATSDMLVEQLKQFEKYRWTMEASLS